MTRLGVFGGTFNPPHSAHLAVARRAREQARLDEVLWIPAALPPHKQDDTVASARHRRRMLEILIDGEPGFRISDVELERSGPSYTADTLEELAARHPDAELYLIIGEDSLRRLQSWYRPDRILRAVSDILVYRRPDAATGEPVDRMFLNRYTMLGGEPIELSSSGIRRALSSRSDPTGALDGIPDDVVGYIRKYDLYTGKRPATTQSEPIPESTVPDIPKRLEERIAQLIFPRIGSNMPGGARVEEDEARVADILERHAVGGLVLFNGDRVRTPHTLSRLQTLASHPLLVTADIERGAGQQIRGATVFPHAFAFSRLERREAEMVKAAARITAREALAAGIHLALGPVADIHSNEANPIISLRAFGSDASTAGRLASAWIEGASAEGLLTCVKHFPGHGDTVDDSHDTTPVVRANRATLESRELAPFRETLKAGADLVMTAHVSYPALDPDGLPATASHPILIDLLRGEMGFEGAIISDSLLMAGAGDDRSNAPGLNAQRLLEAGIDILLDVSDVDAVVDHLVGAVQDGSFDERIINASFRRVWALKTRMMERFGEGVFLDAGLAMKPTELRNDRNRKIADEISFETVRILSGHPSDSELSRVDADTGKGLLGITILANENHADPTGSTLEEAGSSLWRSATWRTITPETPAAERAAIISLADRMPCVVVAPVVKPAAWHQYGLTDDLKILTSNLLGRSNCVLACMGPSSIADELPNASLTLCAWSDVLPSFRAVVRKLRTFASAT
ncbi:MAG: nicotinate (nicotinamide) nucleotide adenylyltransferase [Rhodothermales bacterium]|nr:nicotinate (nicotinamide) nucleotide adenylyltransferase [Rhodothermales bacterium]